MVLSVASLVKPLTDRLWNALFHWWDDAEGREICNDASKRIHKEKPNFEHIVANGTYSKNPLHKRTVTQYSFEELGKAMRKLSRIRKFRRAAAEVARLCDQELSRPAEQREAAIILDLINDLEMRLARWLGE